METELIANLKIALCTKEDFCQILDDIHDFWGSDRTLLYHHPMFLYECGNTCFVIKFKEQVVGYLFGFISQTENLGYIHLIGVRETYQRMGLGHKLYNHYIQLLKQKDIDHIKAITTPANDKSVRFHIKLGMTMIGDKLENGFRIIEDYSGKGQNRVVFKMKI